MGPRRLGSPEARMRQYDLPMLSAPRACFFVFLFASGLADKLPSFCTVPISSAVGGGYF